MPDSAIMDRRKWLLRLIYARFVIFTLFRSQGRLPKGQGQTLEDLQIAAVCRSRLSVCWLLVLRQIRPTCGSPTPRLRSTCS